MFIKDIILYITNGVKNMPEETRLIQHDELMELEQYLQAYVFDNSHRIPKHQKGMLVLLALFGAAWGTPWINAAAGGAIIFPESAQKIFEKIFSAGIVITVGGDGLWIMLEHAKSALEKSAEETALTTKKESTALKISKVAFPVIFSALSCISPVYASIKYNAGLDKFLGIITLIGNFGYGCYGYKKFIEHSPEIILNALRFAHLVRNNPQQQALAETRGKLVGGTLEFLRDPNSTTARLDADQLVQNLLLQADNAPVSTRYAQKALQLFFATVISFSASMVGVYLSKEALKNIFHNAMGAYILAVIAEFPGFVVGMVSTYAILDRLFNVISCEKNVDPKRIMFNQIYPMLSFIIPALIFLTALTAPSAGTYVTYETLEKEGVNPILKWIATSSIIAARVIFSNFTLNNLAEDIALGYYESRNTSSDDANSQKIRLARSVKALTSANAATFKRYLPAAPGVNSDEAVSASARRSSVG